MKHLSSFILKASMLSVVLLTGAANLASAQGLDEYDRALISDYTSLGYSVNSALRDYVDERTDKNVEGMFEPRVPLTSFEDFEANVFRTKYVYHLNRALNKLPLQPRTVYRGIYTNDDAKSLYKKNTVSVSRQFTSATTDKGVAQAFARGKDKHSTCGGCDPDVMDPNPKHMIFLEIASKTGKDISDINANEKEVLFPYGVIFKVVDVIQDNKTKISGPCKKNGKAAKCDYTGFLVVKIQELVDGTLSASDQELLNNSELARTQSLVQKYFGGDSEKMSEMTRQNNSLFEQWKAQGNSLDLEDISFDEGG